MCWDLLMVFLAIRQTPKDQRDTQRGETARGLGSRVARQTGAVSQTVHWMGRPECHKSNDRSGGELELCLPNCPESSQNVPDPDASASPWDQRLHRCPSAPMSVCTGVRLHRRRRALV